ncbi:MAG: dephospho-CoA kinase [Proteobacteria bacterium]|nr:dephospho-CoA kinase [Pseudomonadota bacterium]
MQVIGLTGGIASGKSTVASMLRDLGAHVVDADQLAHRVVEPGQPALAEIAERFGPGVLTKGGTLDRKKLGAIVFADADARRALEAITHPRIRAASQETIAGLAARGAEIIFYEAALIVEKQLHEQPWMSAVVVVSVPPQTQLDRLLARETIGEDEARARIAAQRPLADKIAVAAHVIDNSRSLDETRAQVRELWDTLREAQPS